MLKYVTVLELFFVVIKQDSIKREKKQHFFSKILNHSKEIEFNH